VRDEHFLDEVGVRHEVDALEAEAQQRDRRRTRGAADVEREHVAAHLGQVAGEEVRLRAGRQGKAPAERNYLRGGGDATQMLGLS